MQPVFVSYMSRVAQGDDMRCVHGFYQKILGYTWLRSTHDDLDTDA